ncbi:hypothetical protein C7I87_17230 [Mesorhizobium sp. SARCC-RB16n]|nr:hypothetical protein C7I87_17230 [Mesorhizobium sp. SARCC-RB16n]
MIGKAGHLSGLLSFRRAGRGDQDQRGGALSAAEIGKLVVKLKTSGYRSVFKPRMSAAFA